MCQSLSKVNIHKAHFNKNLRNPFHYVVLTPVSRARISFWRLWKTEPDLGLHTDFHIRSVLTLSSLSRNISSSHQNLNELFFACGTNWLAAVLRVSTMELKIIV
jgi:hypothetical protein